MDLGQQHLLCPAIRFEQAFGINADTLMRMQTAYDMAQARAYADDIIVDDVLAAV